MRCRRGFGHQWMRGMFSGCGYKVTSGRQAILQLLTAEKKHMSAEEIYEKVRAEHPNVGLTSVYRTLEILVEMGTIKKQNFGDGRSRYEFVKDDRGEKHHHHLVCTSCGKVIDYDDFIDEEIKLLKKTEQELSKKYRFQIKDHNLQFCGLCEKCAGK